MRRLTITEQDYGQWVVETSDGKRGSGVSLVSALNKLLPTDACVEAAEMMAFLHALSMITPTHTGQIAHGQAAG